MMSNDSFGFHKHVAGIGITFGILLAVTIWAWTVLSHEGTSLFSLYRQVVLLLLGIVSLSLVKAERQARNKTMFALFAVLGVQQTLDIGYYFAPSLFPGERFAGFFYFQYVTTALGLTVQIACLVGAAVIINTRLSLSAALATSILPIILLALVTFFPMMENPRYLYTVPEITDFRIVDRAWLELHAELRRPPEPEEVAARAGLSRWEGSRWTGELTHEEEVARVADLEPYLFGNNYNMLVFKPLNELWWIANLGAAIILLLLILSWFVGDSPSGVFLDRITILLLCFAVFEVFHFSVYADLKEYVAYGKYFDIGAFLSLLTVLGLIVVFLLRLRFVLSLEGRYYEKRLVEEPIRISRWRDAMDDYIIRAFFSRNPFKNRFLSREESEGK